MFVKNTVYNLYHTAKLGKIRSSDKIRKTYTTTISYTRNLK